MCGFGVRCNWSGGVPNVHMLQCLNNIPPKTTQNFSAEEDLLAQMIQFLGKLPNDLLSRSPKRTELFNDDDMPHEVPRHILTEMQSMSQVLGNYLPLHLSKQFAFVIRK
jgi:hypothetical protein